MEPERVFLKDCRREFVKQMSFKSEVKGRGVTDGEKVQGTSMR